MDLKALEHLINAKLAIELAIARLLSAPEHGVKSEVADAQNHLAQIRHE